MEIRLDGPITITLKPQTMAMVLDLLAKSLPYNSGKEIIEGEIFPQLTKRGNDGNVGADSSTTGGSGSGSGDISLDNQKRHKVAGKKS